MERCQAALGLWRELEADTATRLLTTTTSIDHGSSHEVADVAAALSAAGAPHEVLTPPAASERYPGMGFEGTVIVQPDGGRIDPEAAIAACQRRIVELGGEVRHGLQVTAIAPRVGGVELRSDEDAISANVAIVAAGAWTTSLLGGLMPLPQLTVTREQYLHLQPRSNVDWWPSVVHRPSSGPQVYSVLTPGEGVKLAEHHTGPVVDPEEPSPGPHPAGVDRVLAYARRWMPLLDTGRWTAATCLYTTTPTKSFVIERHGDIVVGSACSGHGAKFMPLVGKWLADLAEPH